MADDDRPPVKPYVPPPPHNDGLGMGADERSANHQRMAQMGEWHLSQTQAVECLHRKVSKWSPKLQVFLASVLAVVAIVLLRHLLRSLFL